MFNFISKFYKDYKLLRQLKTIDADTVTLELADHPSIFYELKYNCEKNGIPYIVKFNKLLIINPNSDQLQNGKIYKRFKH